MQNRVKLLSLMLCVTSIIALFYHILCSDETITSVAKCLVQTAQYDLDGLTSSINASQEYGASPGKKLLS